MVSTRRSAKSRQNASSGDNGSDYHPELEEGGSGPLTARGFRFESRSSRRALTQKGKQPERCRITGRLSKLPGMPLDVLYEIFSLVHPVDLLRMSWASKAFRNVLTSKSSRQVWIATFDNIPEVRRPPPCPEELTELAYANLLYNPCCMDCGALHATAYWTALVRLCEGCIEKWVTNLGGIRKQTIATPSRKEFYFPRKTLPTVWIKLPSFGSMLHVFTKDMKRLIVDLESADDGAAVVRRYEGALAVRLEFAKVLERLDNMAITSGTATLAHCGESHRLGMMGPRRRLMVIARSSVPK